MALYNFEADMKFIADPELLHRLQMVSIVEDAGLLPPDDEDTSFDLARKLHASRMLLAQRLSEMGALKEILAVASPAFRLVLDDVESLPRHISECEDRLKAMSRECKKGLDFHQYNLVVNYANPMRDEVGTQQLLSVCPNAEQLAPEIFEHSVKVDAKKLRMAVQSGQIPDAALSAIQAVPTTRDGRIELKYLDKTPA